jgi:FkbM family methyltransferase
MIPFKRVKKLSKSLLFSTLGPERTRVITRWLRREKPQFSEAELILTMFDARKRKGVMIDVGAHYGESFAPYADRGWKIFAFEPDAENRARLKQSVKLDKVALFDCALSDHEEESVPFFASQESSGISSLSAFRDTHKETNRVHLTTLTKILSQEPISHVDFLKIDTEGHDLFVLKGYPWELFRPEVVLCEFEDYKTRPLGYDYRAMGDFLVNQAYSVFLSEWVPIVRYGGDHQWRSWRSYPCSLADHKGWGNFVAFKPGVGLTSIEEYVRRYTDQSRH